MITAVLREARPKQWVKNLLVFAAPGAAGVLGHGSPFGRTVLIFVAFCLAASGTYFFNDLIDAEADRRHPTKRLRPVAAGLITVWQTRLLGLGLLAAGIVLGLVCRWEAGVVVVAYVTVTLAYTFWGKHVAGLDLALVAAGFVLRAAAGAVAADVTMSIWFVLCTTFGALFIVTGKRYAELREHGDEAAAMRPALTDYNPRLLGALLALWAAATVLAYCLWAIARTSAGSNNVASALSVVPVVAALGRYRVVLARDGGGAPEEVFLRDRWLQVFVAMWLILFGLGVRTH